MKRYTYFLKDKKFIRWQLLSDSSLDEYWKNFIEEHPESENEIHQAITYLKNEGLNKSTLTEKERIILFGKIQNTIRHKKNSKLQRLISFSAAAVALLIIGFLLLYPKQEDKIILADKEHIMGEFLNSEDIQLITGNESMSFQSDIDVKLSGEGKAEIVQNNHDVQKIEIKQDQVNTLIVPFGKRSTLTLADGSKVWLNSGSVLKFPVQFIGNNREISLVSGEMYIEVAPNKKMPFRVLSSDFNIKVYGTKFNVSNYEGSAHSVVLVEGSVSLQSSKSKETFLSPSEQAVYSVNGTFKTQTVNVNQFISWKNGYLEFNKTPMTEVLKQIGRYYNLSFDFGEDSNLQKRTCTGKIYLSENLDNVMTTVGLLSSTKYSKINNKIFITNE
ncbi:MAG: FecR domain-containing protein [Dysgonamonadaceae bacterium]